MPRLTADELDAARKRTIPDVLPGPGNPPLSVLFCGINPGLVSAATGHHFARPGNRFWPALFASGFTDRLLSPFDELELLQAGYGVTNVVMRASATANELTREELLTGGKRLVTKVKRYEPAFLAILGLGAYRTAWSDPKAVIGRQGTQIGDTVIWVLPNPSGLNAHYQASALAEVFRELHVAVKQKCRGGRRGISG